MKTEQARYPVDEFERNDKFDELVDPARRKQIPHTVRTPEPNEKFGELALLTAVAVLLALVAAMAVSGLFR